jgi:DNA-binding NarL/FixJ family response regulator
MSILHITIGDIAKRVSLSREISVAIFEDDVFARNWMALLLVRDWRTRLVGEFDLQADLFASFSDPNQKFDVLIIDVDLFGDYFKLDDFFQALQTKNPNIKILLTSIRADLKILQQNQDAQIAGYVLKGEIGYALSWVITFVSEGRWVLTPGVQTLAHENSFLLPANALVLDGRRTILEFTDHEAEVARMAFIFSVGRRDLADELKISEQWSYGLVSELYRKMGLADIIAGESDLFSFIGESEIIKRKFKEIMDQLGDSKKARDMESLAFHLLTMPEIVQ